jgi:hypothetical protein
MESTMRNIHSLRLLCLFALTILPAVAFSLPVVCTAAPAPGVLNHDPDEAAADAAFTKAQTDAPGCTKTIATLCASTKADLASLEANALKAAISSDACVANGTTAAGGALPSSDSQWYSMRAGFWYALYKDMMQNAASVSAGTYQISTTVSAQFIGLAPPAAPVVAATPSYASSLACQSQNSSSDVVNACKAIGLLYYQYRSCGAPPCHDGSVVTVYEGAISAARTAAISLGAVVPQTTQTGVLSKGFQIISDRLANNEAGFKSGTFVLPDALTLLANLSNALNSSITPEVSIASISFGNLLADQAKCGKSNRIQSCPNVSADYDAAIVDAKAAFQKLTTAASDASESAESKASLVAQATLWSNAADELSARRDDFMVGKYTIPASGIPPAGLSGSYRYSSNFLGLIGVSYAGASSTDPQTKLYANVAADIPLAKTHIPGMSQLGAWGYGRIGSISQNVSQTPGTVIQPSQVVAAYSSLSSATPSQIVQSFEMKGGLSIETEPRPGVPGFKSVFALIASGGALTPASPNQTQTASQTYQLTSDVKNYFITQTLNSPDLSGCTNLAANSSSLSCLITVYTQSRGRFYRSYDAGFRLKLYPKVRGVDAELFPGILDLTVGQNDYVTGGGFRGPVIHGSVSFPLFSGSYAFASMDIATYGKGDSGPIFLSPTPAQLTNSTATPPTVTVLTVQVQPPNRDRYMIGFGVDLIYLLRNHLLQDAVSKP